jgi:hypothetical protein
MRVFLGDNPDLVVSFQIGSCLEMGAYSIGKLIDRTEPYLKYALLAITWNTSDEVYQWLRDSKIENRDIEFNKQDGFLKNLYRGWNACVDRALEFAPYVMVTATDHHYSPNFLDKLYEQRAPNRIVCSKLIESGDHPSIHTTKHFGIVGPNFREAEFDEYCKGILKDEIIDDKDYPHRSESMPWLLGSDVWQKIRPFNDGYTTRYLGKYGRWTGMHHDVTGDTDAFERAREAGIEIKKVMSAISYHNGAVETSANKGVYS